MIVPTHTRPGLPRPAPPRPRAHTCENTSTLWPAVLSRRTSLSSSTIFPLVTMRRSTAVLWQGHGWGAAASARRVWARHSSQEYRRGCRGSCARRPYEQRGGCSLDWAPPLAPLRPPLHRCSPSPAPPLPTPMPPSSLVVLVAAVVVLRALKQEGVVAAFLQLHQHVEQAHPRVAWQGAGPAGA
jgi:hypothetical protein